MVRIVLILIFIATQVAFGAPSFLLRPEHYWLRAFAYSFFHANWWHLSLNSIAAWSIFVPSRKWLKMLLAAYLIAVLVYPLSFRPVIGFSNVLYAVIGLRTPPLSSKWWRQYPVLLFFAVTLAMAFIPCFSATTHIAAFLLGTIGAASKRTFNKITGDFRRYI